jgi:2-isopropylmalate synthase
MHSKIFGDNAPDHLVFAAGFTSIAPQEVDTIKFLADNVDTCQIAVNCRSVKDEIIESINAVKNAKYPRVAFVLPASERLCELMLHKTPREVFDFALDFSKFVLDKVNGIPADIQLAAAYDGDPILIAELADALTEMGIATIGLGDTRGKIYPLEIRNFYNTLFKHSKNTPLIAPHLHNDLGFALQNTIEGLYQGVTFASTSWLGLAERSGLLRTELLTFLLAYQKENLFDRIGVDCSNLFYNELDLKQIPIISSLVSKYTNVPLKVNDIIVGTGVNSISTGTPFVDTVSFQLSTLKKFWVLKKKFWLLNLQAKE